MDNNYFLVSWVHENPVRHTVMSQSDIIDPNVRNSDVKNLVGSEVALKWNARQSCIGKILAYGTKVAMSMQLKILLKEILPVSAVGKTSAIKIKRTASAVRGPIKRAKLQIRAPAEGAAEIGELLSSMQEESFPLEEALNKVQQLETEMDSLKKRNLELEDEIQILRNKETTDGDALVDIGNRVMVQKHTLAAFRTVSSNLNAYGRNLFRHLFETHEVIGYTLMGKSCNATSKTPQPSIDCRRRDAILDHSLETFKLTPGSQLYSLAKKELKKKFGILNPRNGKRNKEHCRDY